MLIALQLWPPLSRNQQRHPRLTPLLSKCVLTKQGQRFLTKVTTLGDPSATKSLIRKFVETSPKSIALGTLSHLLCPNNPHSDISFIALSLYARISDAAWFNWNPKLVAELVALLDKQGRYGESETLISEAVSKLESRERELALFYCNLIESHSKQNSKRGFDNACAYLNQLLHNSSSVYIKRRAYEYIVSGLCTMGRPRQAENLVQDMRISGLKPSAFEFKSILYGYGRLGLFQDLQRILTQMEKDEFLIDTICSNMVLSSYGAHNELVEMVSWLRRMRNSNIPFSVRTYNTVLNSCPTIMEMLQDLTGIPLVIEELMGSLKGDEASAVCELIGSSTVMEDVMRWDTMEAKLDLHGLHLGSSYLILLQWLEEMQQRFNESKCLIPAEVVVVCGSGKHSNVRGISPVKGLVKDMMVRMKSPLKIDRKNVGCFVAKGRIVRDWLCAVRKET